jgi:hypothetical protein
MPAVFPDSLEVLVYSTMAGPTLVAAIELISPSNKDREEHRRAFATICSSYVVYLQDILYSQDRGKPHEYVRILDQERHENQERYTDLLTPNILMCNPTPWRTWATGTSFSSTPSSRLTVLKRRVAF